MPSPMRRYSTEHGKNGMNPAPAIRFRRDMPECVAMLNKERDRNPYLSGIGIPSYGGDNSRIDQ